MSTGSFVKHAIDAMVETAAGSKRYKTSKGTTSFRVSRGVGGLGWFSIAVGMIFVFPAIFSQEPYPLGWLILTALFDVLGLPLVITTAVARVRVTPQGITYRNAVGISRSMRFEDIRCAYACSLQGDIKLCGRYANLKLGSYFAGFSHLKALIEEAQPGVFGAEAVLASEDFRTAEGVAAFRQGMALTNVGLFIALLGVGAALLPTYDSMAQLLSKIAVSGSFTVMGLYFMLDGLVSRVYLEPDRLVYRNFRGAKTALAWQDIRKVSARFTRGRSRREYLLVSGKDYDIKIKRNFIAYDLLKSEIDRRRDHPSAAG
jgi:hypothetical protein